MNYSELHVDFIKELFIKTLPGGTSFISHTIYYKSIINVPVYSQKSAVMQSYFRS